MQSWFVEVSGNDVDRAKAIIRTRTNRWNLRFVVRELPDRRSDVEKERDKKNVVLWTLNGWVHKPARFELPARREWNESDSYSEDEGI